MAIMQKVVACVGKKRSLRRSAEVSRKDSPETVLSRRGCLRARAKWSFPLCQTIVKMIPKVWARRDEYVDVGFTSIGVTGKKLWPDEV